MITTLKKLRCCCTSLYRADAVRYGIMMLVLVVVGLLSMVQPVTAQGVSDTACIKEATGLNNPACVANDVRIGSFRVVDGPTNCDPTSDVPITVTLEATIESGPARYDVGIWINQAGGSARSDTTGDNCYRDFLHPVGTSTVCNQTGGAYYNADGDGCGDVYAVGTDPCGNRVIGPCTDGGGGTCLFTTFTFTVDILCRDSNNDGTGDVGSCTSWEQNIAPVCSDALDTNPGTGSKCNCGTTNIIGLHIGCSVDSDCNDENACTTDTCSIIGNVGTCVNENISCDDSNECTTDSCDPATGCTHGTVSCDDGNACTSDSCDPATGCAHETISCDDGNACTSDSCDPATGCAHETISCNDGNACTNDSCNPASGCVNTTINCNDGNACTDDSCNPASGCVNTTISCDDGDACTVDSCDPADGCHNTGSCEVDTKITPTGTTCTDYTSGTAADLTELLYGTKGGAINSVSPGVFFLYDGIHLDATGTVTVAESDGPWTRVIGVNHAQVILYDLSCNRVNVGTVSVDEFGNVTITGVPEGDYILSIKYDPTTLKGYDPPTDSTTYSFAVTAGGAPSGSDSINVNPKP